MQIMGLLTEERPDLTSAGASGTVHINEASLEHPIEHFNTFSTQKDMLQFWKCEQELLFSILFLLLDVAALNAASMLKILLFLDSNEQNLPVCGPKIFSWHKNPRDHF